MALFGSSWLNYQEKIATNWKKSVAPDDIILLGGDLSWAMKWEEALPDLFWIDALPGQKIILKGNHDPWWSSRKKMESSLPPFMRAFFTDPIQIEGIWLGGTRLWDHPSTFCPEWINWSGPREPMPSWSEREEKIFQREIKRLHLILKQIPKNAYKVIVTHYPPLHPSLSPSNPCSLLFEEYQVNKVIFGHIHNLKKDNQVPFGTKNNIDYIYTAADYLQFQPQHILSF